MATSLALGRGDGMAFATGVCFWGLVAATGLGVLLATVGWLFGAPKIAGALHLLWLAYKSMRSAVRSESSAGIAIGRAGLWRRGVAVHLTNPKAVLGWAAEIAVGVGALAYRPPPRLATLTATVAGPPGIAPPAHSRLQNYAYALCIECACAVHSENRADS